MALIKCPECGKGISNRALSCPSCGCPVEESLRRGRIINSEEVSDTSSFIVVHGYKEIFSVDANVSIYKEGDFVGKVAPATTFLVPIENDCDLMFKGSIRKCTIHVRKGIETDVYLSFDRFSGKLKAYTATVDTKSDMEQLREHKSKKATLNSIILVLLLTLLSIIMFIFFKNN